MRIRQEGVGMRRGQSGRLRQTLLAGGAWITLAIGVASAQDADMAIPAQALSQTLKDISRQTGENILFTPESVSGRRAPALNGHMSALDAVTRALAGSGLEAEPDGNGGLIIRESRQRKAQAAAYQEDAT